MTLIYRSKWIFTHDSYCQSVCGLAFNSDGSYLAYASGENVCILDIEKRQLMMVIRGRSTNKGLTAVTALVWLPQERFHLVCTFQDGIIASITRSSVRPAGTIYPALFDGCNYQNQLHLVGVDSMIPSITHIAANTMGSRLATGGDTGISIWSSDRDSTYFRLCGGVCADLMTARIMAVGETAWISPAVPGECQRTCFNNGHALV